jgi:hypothetical protein
MSFPKTISERFPAASQRPWAIDSADSTRLRSDTATDIGEKVLRWFARIGAAVIKPIKYHLRTRYSAANERRAESTSEEAKAIAAATENAIAAVTENAVLTTTKSFTVPVTAGVKVDTDTPIDTAASTVPDQEEIQRRRDLVRMLFNDFWSEAHDKPTAFVERLDQAEDYLNERLKANGEVWRLDTKRRIMLGLPPRANSPDNGKNRAAPV